MRSMPTEIKKNRPDDQMTSCFLKLYTLTRVCEIIIRNWSAGQLVSPKNPNDIRRNGQKKKGNTLAELARTGHRGHGGGEGNTGSEDAGHRTMRGGGSRNDARKMHREKPAFNAGERTKEEGDAASQAAQ